MRRGMGAGGGENTQWIIDFCTLHPEIDQEVIYGLYSSFPSIRASLDPNYAILKPYVKRTSGYALTAYYPSSNTSVDMKSRVNSYSGNPFFYYNVTSLSRMYCNILDGTQYQPRYGSARNKMSTSIVGAIWRFYSNKNVFYIEGGSTLTLSSSTFTSAETLKVFNDGATFNCDMFNLEFSENGSAKLWLIPYEAVNPATGNREGCFADICSGDLLFDYTGNGGFTYYSE